MKQEIEALLKQAEQTDAAEDAQYCKDKHGDELPVELQRRESRLQRLLEIASGQVVAHVKQRRTSVNFLRFRLVTPMLGLIP